MSSERTAPTCLIAESLEAASRVAGLLGDEVPQVLLTEPHWHAALSPFVGGHIVIALEDLSQLPDLMSLASELPRFDSVELMLGRDTDPNLVADIVSFYRWTGLRSEPIRESAQDIHLSWPDADSAPTSGRAHEGLLSGASLLSGWLHSVSVAFLGDQCQRLLGAPVRSVDLSLVPNNGLEEETEGWFNILAMDATLSLDSEQFPDLVSIAQGMGARLILVSPGIIDQDPAVDDFDLLIERAATTWVDPTWLNPFGYRRVVDGRFAVVGSVVGGRSGVDEGLSLLEELAGSGGVDVFGLVRRVSLPEGVRVFGGGFEEGLVDRLRGYAGVVDHPGFHDSNEGRAEVLVGLAAAGVPAVALGVDQPFRALVGDELADVLTSGRVEDLKDPEARDRLSVRLRRIGLSTGSQVTRWREIAGALDLAVEPLPKVSVILTTNRPDFLEHALTQVRNQTYPSIELVLVLHGDEFTRTDSQLETLYQSPLIVERIPSSVVFGEAINRGVAASTGSLIAKMDDDDWYSPQHLWDLVRAMDYSGADLVGKAAEFVYLEELDITIRRMVEGSETYGNRNLGGGTFLIKRTTLNTIGGWRRIPINEDRKLIDDVLLTGRIIYRTFGHGYLLNRHKRRHLWTADDSYFTRQAHVQKGGLDVEWAMP